MRVEEEERPKFVSGVKQVGASDAKGITQEVALFGPGCVVH